MKPRILIVDPQIKFVRPSLIVDLDLSFINCCHFSHPHQPRDPHIHRLQPHPHSELCLFSAVTVKRPVWNFLAFCRGEAEFRVGILISTASN